MCYYLFGNYPLRFKIPHCLDLAKQETNANDLSKELPDSNAYSFPVCHPE